MSNNAHLFSTTAKKNQFRTLSFDRVGYFHGAGVHTGKHGMSHHDNDHDNDHDHAQHNAIISAEEAKCLGISPMRCWGRFTRKKSGVTEMHGMPCPPGLLLAMRAPKDLYVNEPISIDMAVGIAIASVNQSQFDSTVLFDEVMTRLVQIKDDEDNISSSALGLIRSVSSPYPSKFRNANASKPEIHHLNLHSCPPDNTAPCLPFADLCDIGGAITTTPSTSGRIYYLDDGYADPSSNLTTTSTNYSQKSEEGIQRRTPSPQLRSEQIVRDLLQTLHNGSGILADSAGRVMGLSQTDLKALATSMEFSMKWMGYRQEDYTVFDTGYWQILLHITITCCEEMKKMVLNSNLGLLPYGMTREQVEELELDGIEVATNYVLDVKNAPSSQPFASVGNLSAGKVKTVVIGSVVASVLLVLLCGSIAGVYAWIALRRRDERMAALLMSNITPPTKIGDEATFVVTDIEGSTALAEMDEVTAATCAEVHNSILRDQLKKHGGCEVSTAGDAFTVVFRNACDALEWACSCQLALTDSEEWPKELVAISKDVPTVADVTISEAERALLSASCASEQLTVSDDFSRRQSLSHPAGAHHYHRLHSSPSSSWPAATKRILLQHGLRVRFGIHSGRLSTRDLHQSRQSPETKKSLEKDDIYAVHDIIVDDAADFNNCVECGESNLAILYNLESPQSLAGIAKALCDASIHGGYIVITREVWTRYRTSHNNHRQPSFDQEGVSSAAGGGEVSVLEMASKGIKNVVKMVSSSGNAIAATTTFRSISMPASDPSSSPQHSMREMPEEEEETTRWTRQSLDLERPNSSSSTTTNTDYYLSQPLRSTSDPLSDNISSGDPSSESLAKDDSSGGGGSSNNKQERPTRPPPMRSTSLQISPSKSIQKFGKNWTLVRTNELATMSTTDSASLLERIIVHQIPTTSDDSMDEAMPIVESLGIVRLLSETKKVEDANMLCPCGGGGGDMMKDGSDATACLSLKLCSDRKNSNLSSRQPDVRRSQSFNRGADVVVEVLLCLPIGLRLRAPQFERTSSLSGLRNVVHITAPFTDAPLARPIMRMPNRLVPVEGQVTLLFLNIAHFASLAADDSHEWQHALATSVDLLRKYIHCALKRHKGYECEDNGSSFLLAFHSPTNAALFAIEVNLNVQWLPWPSRLLDHDLCAELVVRASPSSSTTTTTTSLSPSSSTTPPSTKSFPEAADLRSLKVDRHGNVVVQRGLRLKMGFVAGIAARCFISPMTGRAQYHGSIVNRAARLASTAPTGHIYTCKRTWTQVLGESRQIPTNLWPLDVYCAEDVHDVSGMAMGAMDFRGVKEGISVVQIMTSALAYRPFPRH